MTTPTPNGMVFSSAFLVKVTPTFLNACFTACIAAPCRYWRNIFTPAFDPTRTVPSTPACPTAPVAAIRYTICRLSSDEISYPKTAARHMHILTWSFIHAAVSAKPPARVASAVPIPGTTPASAVALPKDAASRLYRRIILSAARRRSLGIGSSGAPDRPVPCPSLPTPLFMRYWSASR